MDKTLNKTNHLATLDGLRGIAALAVLVSHICELLRLPVLLPHVYMAVDFFFMLSGYVVAKAYEAKLKAKMSFPEFVVVRLRRLYPMIFITTIMGAAVFVIRMAITHTVTPEQILTATLCGFFLIPTPVMASVMPGSLFPINSATWSLYFELVVNFAYAPLARYLTDKRLIALCVVSGVTLAYAAARNHGLEMGWGTPNFFWGFARATFPFTIGVLLFRHAMERRTGGTTTVILTAILIAALFAPIFDGNWLYEMLILICVFPPLVYFGASCANEPRLNQICLQLGALSYPLYLVHHSVIRVAANAFQILHVAVSPFFIAAACFFVSIGASFFLLKVWDEPVRKWLATKRAKHS